MYCQMEQKQPLIKKILDALTKEIVLFQMWFLTPYTVPLEKMVLLASYLELIGVAQTSAGFLPSCT